MSWEEQLFTVLDDLEQQAQGAFGVERDLEVAERAAAEYAAVTLAARLMASVGRDVALSVQGVGTVAGTLRRVADGWCLVRGATGEWIVRTAGIAHARGLSGRAVPEAAWPAAARLGLGSALRGVAAGGGDCRMLLRDGTAYQVGLLRIGGDFAEVRAGAADEPLVVAFDGLAAVHRTAV